jgi:YVTN family beta-propeller protein
MSSWKRTLLCLSVGALLAACGGDKTPDPTPEPEPQPQPGPEPLKPTLFVGAEGSLISYDLETGQQRPGRVPEVSSPTDLQVLEDGTVLVNLTVRNEVLVVDGRTLEERARIPSKGERPNHSYVSPPRNGKRYWMTLNDGLSSQPESSTALFVDATPGSPTYLQAVGSVRLGRGHHKASFSNTRERVVISNLSDCDDVLSVYDYSDVKNVQKVLSLSAGVLGMACSLTAPLTPHGCATSKVSGRAYCNLTGPGVIASVDLDAPTPTARLIYTGGKGGGHTVASADGRFIYTVQELPREGNATHTGAPCQVGQLVMVDTSSDNLAGQVPLLYRGPSCNSPLAGTDEAKATASHLLLSRDGKTLYITASGAFDDAASRVRQQLVLDLSQPFSPAQKPSISVGNSLGSHAVALSSEGRYLFVANTVDNSLSQIDTTTNTVVSTINLPTNARTMSLYSSADGPSEHVGSIR